MLFIVEPIDLNVATFSEDIGYYGVLQSMAVKRTAMGKRLRFFFAMFPTSDSRGAYS